MCVVSVSVPSLPPELSQGLTPPPSFKVPEFWKLFQQAVDSADKVSPLNKKAS